MNWHKFDNCKKIQINLITKEEIRKSIYLMQSEILKLNDRPRYFLLWMHPNEWYVLSCQISCEDWEFGNHVIPAINNKIAQGTLYMFGITSQLLFEPEKCCVVGILEHL